MKSSWSHKPASLRPYGRVSHKPHRAEQREVLVFSVEANRFRASDGNVVDAPYFANADVLFGGADWDALIEPANDAESGIHGMKVARDAGRNNLVDQTTQ